jgi:tetratricopeptide (TPR) repeat protein
MFAGAAAWAAGEDPFVDCMSDDNNRRIDGCSRLLDTQELNSEQRSLAFGQRALAYSLLGMFEKALADYNDALQIKPDFPLALNNRAWSYFKLGRPLDGLPDVEHALRLDPGSPAALDTRAHIRQAQGDTAGALQDYLTAMQSGGASAIKMYQCGLRSQGLYFGSLDGKFTSTMGDALRTCVGTRYCDPLPSDSECRPEVS